MRARIRSETYRRWSIDEWCDFVRPLGVDSLTGWAAVDGASYRRAVALGLHRRIAERLGWKCRLADGAPETLSDEEFARLFREKGVRTASDVWSVNCAWASLLSRQNRLGRVLELAGARRQLSRHEDDVEYFLRRCRRYDFFEAWTCAERTVAAIARARGLMEEVRRRSRRRPTRFTTHGGPVRSLGELVVARALELNGIPFKTEPLYPMPGASGRRGRPMRADFLIGTSTLAEVWGIAPFRGGRSQRERNYALRRAAKRDLCARHGLRLVSIEGWLLHTHGLEVFLHHVALALQDAAPGLVVDIEPQVFLALQSPSHEGRNFARDMDQLIGRGFDIVRGVHVPRRVADEGADEVFRQAGSAQQRRHGGAQAFQDE